MKSVDVTTHIQDIQDKCGFCTIRLQQFIERKEQLPEPTPEFPAGMPSDGA